VEELTVRSAFAIRPLEWEPGVGKRYPVEIDSYYRPCLKNVETLILQADKNRKELSKFGYQIALRNGIQSLSLIPLVTGRKVLGMTWLGEMRSWKRSSFTPEKIALCRGIANRGAMAIENVLLYEQLRENHTYLKRVKEGHLL